MKVSDRRRAKPDKTFGAIRPGRLFSCGDSVYIKGQDGVGRTLAVNMKTGEIAYLMDSTDVLKIDEDRQDLSIW